MRKNTTVKNKKINKTTTLKKAGIQYLLVAVCIFAAFLICPKPSETVCTAMRVILIVLLVIGGFYAFQQEEKWSRILFLILVGGIVMRTGYMLYTSCIDRAYDFRGINLDGCGHAAYILYILQGKLPPTNNIQFYHPPLFHALSAVVIKFVQFFLRQTNATDIMEGGKIISCIASCYTLLLVKSICKQAGINKKYTCTAVAVIAFFPNFYLMAGRVNNDSLAIFFMVLAMLYTMRWYEEQSKRNTALLAIATGLGMMTKISAVTVAFFTAAVMADRLVFAVKEKKISVFCWRIALFAAICLPLALWYPIRNLILFSQPFGYVLAPWGLEFECEKYSFVQRFLTFPVQNLFNPVFADAKTDYNIFLYSIKSALFGEFKFRPQTVAQMLLGAYLPICLFFTAGTVYAAVKIRKKEKTYSYLFLLYVIIWVSYLIFNIKYPFGCTMDYRYIAHGTVVAAVFAAAMLQNTNFKAVKIIYTVCICIFCFLSAYMYCII